MSVDLDLARALRELALEQSAPLCSLLREDGGVRPDGMGEATEMRGLTEMQISGNGWATDTGVRGTANHAPPLPSPLRRLTPNPSLLTPKTHGFSHFVLWPDT